MRPPKIKTAFAVFIFGLGKFLLRIFYDENKILGMRKRHFTSIFVLVCLMPCVAGAEEIFGLYTVGENVVVNEALDVTGSVIIENHGIINGNINVNGGYSVAFKNYGEINGNYLRTVSGETKQMVTSASNIRGIPNASGYIIEAQSENPSVPLNMFDIVNISDGATTIVLKNSAFLIDRVIPYSDVPIDIQGDGVWFYVDGNIGEFSGALLSNVGGDTPFVNIINTDGMYEASSYWLADKLYVSIVRQTNYSLFMDNALGNFLDELRRENPDDKLLSALDSAPNRNAMNKILSESGRTNPIRLMDFSKTISRMNMYNDDGLFGAFVRPWYLYSHDFSMYGADVGIGAKLANNFTGAFSLYGGKLDFDGKYDEYSAFVYGAKIDAMYRDSDWYFKTDATFASAKFNELNVFDGAAVVKNPSGMNFDFVADGGMVFSVADDISLVPFVGVRADYATVAGANDTNACFRIGANADMKTVVDGNTYDAGVRAFFESDTSVYGGIYTNMLSNVDGVGGGLDFGVLYDDMGLSLKISLNAKFIF